MSAMSAIYSNIWEFIENPRIDELSEPIGAFEVQFERYINRPTKREFVLVTFYKDGVYIPDMWGPGEAERLWCYRVEVRETQSNMAFREGHREWNEELF